MQCAIHLTLPRLGFPGPKCGKKPYTKPINTGYQNVVQRFSGSLFTRSNLLVHSALTVFFSRMAYDNLLTFSSYSKDATILNESSIGSSFISRQNRIQCSRSGTIHLLWGLPYKTTPSGASQLSTSESSCSSFLLLRGRKIPSAAQNPPTLGCTCRHEEHRSDSVTYGYLQRLDFQRLTDGALPPVLQDSLLQGSLVSPDFDYR